MSTEIRALSFTQTYVLPAPPGRVAASFLNASDLQAAIPGCKEVRKISEGKYWVVAHVGLLSMAFEIGGMLTVKATTSDVMVSGTLRTKNFAIGKLEAVMTLAEKGTGTLVVSTTTLTPTRRHSILLRKAAKAVGRSVLKAFLGNLASTVAA